LLALALTLAANRLGASERREVVFISDSCKSAFSWLSQQGASDDVRQVCWKSIQRKRNEFAETKQLELTFVRDLWHELPTLITFKDGVGDTRYRMENAKLAAVYSYTVPEPKHSSSGGGLDGGGRGGEANEKLPAGEEKQTDSGPVVNQGEQNLGAGKKPNPKPAESFYVLYKWVKDEDGRRVETYFSNMIVCSGSANSNGMEKKAMKFFDDIEPQKRDGLRLTSKPSNPKVSYGAYVGTNADGKGEYYLADQLWGSVRLGEYHLVTGAEKFFLDSIEEVSLVEACKRYEAEKGIDVRNRIQAPPKSITPSRSSSN
jgi:hypothetical protein